MSHHPGEKKVCILLSTCPPEVAEQLATALVEKSHVACVNIVPQVTSIYRWQGKLERGSECLLVIKCAREQVKEVTAALLKEHPYEVPEVLALKVKGGNPAYLDWVVGAASAPVS